MEYKWYRKKLTVQEVCDIVGVDLPDEYKGMANEKFANITSRHSYLKNGSGYFLLANNLAERQERLERAIAEKAKVVFVGKKVAPKFKHLDKIPHIIVDNAYTSAMKVCARFHDMLDIEVVGVTGSLGKTTTKDMIYFVLKEKYLTERSRKNGNTLHPMMNHLQKMLPGVKMYIQEFGAAAKGSLDRMVPGCIPNVAIITNISDPHLDKFGTKENILAEKEKLITYMEDGCPAFLNYDDPLLRKLEYDNHPIISFAINNHDADYYADNIETESEYMSFDVVCNREGGKRIPIKLYVYGEYNVINAVCAVAVGKYYKLTDQQIINGLADFESEGIRQNLVHIGGYDIYLDCYNTAPISLVGAMEVLSKFPVREGGKHIAVVADIARLGDASPELHRETGQKYPS